jgi:hypothetical protein
MNIYAGDSGLVRASQFQSTIAQGAAPFTVVSTTKVTNLNADLLDGMTATSAATANTIMARNGSANSALNKLTSVNIDNSGNIETQTFESSGASTVNGILNAVGGLEGTNSYPEIDRFRMKRYVESYNNMGNQSGSIGVDCSSGNNFRIRITGSTNTLSFNSVPGTGNRLYSMSILIVNSGSGQNLNFPSSVNWPGGSPPSRSTGSGDVDIWIFQTYDGTNWYGNLSLLDMS